MPTNADEQATQMVQGAVVPLADKGECGRPDRTWNAMTTTQNHQLAPSPHFASRYDPAFRAPTFWPDVTDRPRWPASGLKGGARRQKVLSILDEGCPLLVKHWTVAVHRRAAAIRPPEPPARLVWR